MYLQFKQRNSDLQFFMQILLFTSKIFTKSFGKFVVEFTC